MKFTAKEVKITAAPGMEVNITPDPRIAEEQDNATKGRDMRACKLICPVILISIWAGGLSFVGWLVCRWVTLDLLVPTDELRYATFLPLAACGGAVGAWLAVIHQLHRYVFEVQRDPRTDWSATNNKFIKPVLWPLAGAAVGVFIASVLCELDTDPLRIAAVAISGGIAWQIVVSVAEKGVNAVKNLVR